MTKFIRWQGLTAFIVILGLILGCVYLFAEPIVKMGIEKSVSHYTGAEVNVDSVTLKYSPLIVEVNNLQATDPKQPEKNLLSFTEAKIGADLWQYLLGKIVIEDITVTGLSFNTKRDSIGDVFREIKEEKATDDKTDYMSSLQQSLPDPNELLNNSNLKTVKRAAALEESYDAEKQKLAAIKAQLPTKAKLDEYKKQVKALSKSKVKNLEDLNKVKTQFDELKKSFKADQAIVKEAKNKIIESKQLLSKQLTELKNAPEEDWQDISKKYQLEELDAEDFAQILFGEQAREYYQYAELAMQHIKPLLGKGDSVTAENSEQPLIAESGRFIDFEDDGDIPSFIVKRAMIDMNIANGSFRLSIDELTHQHWIRNRPTAMNLQSIQLGDSGDIKFNSSFAMTQTQDVTADGQWSISKLPLSEMSLRESSDITLIIEKALLAGDGKFVIDKRQLTSNSHLALSNNIYNANSSSKIGKILVDTITAMDTLALSIGANGELMSPTLSIASPLDGALKNALQQQLQQKLAGFKNTLQSGLNSKLSNALSLGGEQQNDLLNIDSLLNNTDKQLTDLENSDIVKQHKDKLKDKVKDKIGKLFG